MNNTELETLIRTILTEKLENQTETTTAPVSPNQVAIFADVDSAIKAAHDAYHRYHELPLKCRSAILDTLRRELDQDIAYLAEEGVRETGMGNVAHKVLKNRLALEKTPGIEDLTTTALTGDDGMVLFEYSPYGVIGSITPSTNPTETIINNSISMLAAGNAIYFSPHPGAKALSIWLIKRIENLIYKTCGIHNLVVTVSQPSFENTQIMMQHPNIAVLAVTGGPGIVDMALRSGKKTIGAGAGNPPCLVDETAEIVKAAQDVVSGASLDNNIPCIAEKALIVVEQVANDLIAQMIDFGALLIQEPAQVQALKSACLSDGKINKNLIGKSPAAILEAAGIPVPGKEPKLLIVETMQDDPLVMHEQLMPVLPVVRVRDFEQGVTVALEVEGGLHHTAIMHSQNVSRLNKVAQLMQTSIFVKNGPSYAGIGFGAEGFCTFTIATPTGEGTTSARTFCRLRRCTLTNGFSIR
ncbi:aldehyde dehydrogenase family protein [Vibrio mangrovi]|uniref:Aldehyde dehydrogenase family protein n=1 Tax=Vibrio mangrovi TaxID=474394 RepID=A0A1Y6IYB9_9VIBR|nr:aldehyde dehydrogenase family protein [Vibrio mangrovi]MDW6005174.1 aldehyde dehydrogenase family protein [Vibrio mangrovi]SMS02616.1 Aldehyde-alcohol dehydrogenase [Vibrio mangrovi]